MAVVDVQEAKSMLPDLLRRAEAGEEVIISRRSEPLVRLVPIRPSSAVRLGCDAGAFEVPDDFDAPLPAEVDAPWRSSTSTGGGPGLAGHS